MGAVCECLMQLDLTFIKSQWIGEREEYINLFRLWESEDNFGVMSFEQGLLL